jgi:hypothetical protein
MQYNHLMTDIVFAIRARLSPQYKQCIKTSNPELLGDLADIYHSTQDLTLRSFIEELMQHAGTTWLALLHKSPSASSLVHLHSAALTVNSPTASA